MLPSTKTPGGASGVFRESAAEPPPGAIHGGPLPRLSRLALTASLLLAAGCGGTLYLTVKGTSPQPPVEVFDCVKREIGVLGYSQTSYDVDEHRLTARKYDWQTRSADTLFRRIVERLSIDIGSSAEGGAQLRVEAHTFSELTTQRGPTEVEREASPAARTAAQALLEACGS